MLILTILETLQLNRDQFDQLLINIVCEHKTRIETLEGKVIDLQSQIDTLNNTSQVEELFLQLV